MTQRRLSGDRSGDIAIVGMAVNLPGAATLDAFWDNLANGIESISRLDPAALKAAGEDPRTLRRDTYVPAAGLLDGYDMFDAEVFGFGPKEAAILDPQHRKFLETAWEALENAGRTGQDFDGRVGVFAGCGAGSYLYLNLLSNPDLVDDLGPFQLRNTGNDKDFLATRVSHVLDLKGPSINIQTACSTALVGVHQAAKALRDGDCDMALAGGVSVEMPHGRGYLYRENDILSPDGHCRAFDHKAGGTVMGSGAGAVVLRRLEDALADGDHVWAVIKGTGINNDGADKAGFFAPSEAGQSQVVGQALDAAGIAPETIAYVECHGTGTLLGDPFEVAGLTEAWRARGAEGAQVCGIGSVQTNVGNLDTAAAAAGLVKTALALAHAEIPPSLNYEAPNPMIDFAASPFYVNDRRAAWPEGETPRRAAVNTLGVGGTNAHAVLEQAPARPASEPGLFPFQPIVLSARSDAALDAMAARLARHLRAHPEQPLADVAFTLMEGRRRFDRRRVLVAADHAEAAMLLETGDAQRVFTHTRLGSAPEVVFAFPGAPAIAPDALRDLYQTEPVFHDWMERGFAALGAPAGEDLRRLCTDAGAPGEETAGRCAAPALAPPLTVMLGVAMAQLTLSWGVAPVALVGAAAGEIAAAVVAGVIGYEDAVRLAHLQGRLATAGPAARDAARAELRGFAGGRELHTPGMPLVSARTGAPITPEQATSPETWVNATGDESRLGEALGGLAAAPDRLFVALAHDPGLTARVLATEGMTADRLVDALDGPATPAAGDVHFIGALARLWALGVAPDWAQFWAGAHRHRVPVPGYSFQRARYLIEPGQAAAAGPDAAARDLMRRDDIADWGWRPAWYPAHAACETDVANALDRAPKQTWLVFEDNEGIAGVAFERLEAVGHTVVRVTPGDTFAEVGERRYTLLSEQGREGYDALFSDLAEKGLTPTRIAHFWGLFGADSHRLGSDPFHDNMEYGFYSLTYLAQALGRTGLDGPVHILAVTRDAASVRGEPIAAPQKATIAGPAGVMSRELPGVTCATLDLDPSAPAPARKGLFAGGRPARGRFARRAQPDHDALALRLLEDLLADPSNEVAAWRDGRRYRQAYVRAKLAMPETPAFRDGGTYLVTGGLGDLGLEAARGLVERHRARVILVGRRALPPRAAWDAVLARSAPGDRTAAAIRGVQALEAAGGTVEVATADVTNLEAMRAVVAAASGRHGRIDGVLHAAGVLDDGPLLDRDAQAMEQVFAPKIDGLRVLDELFADGATDLMVLFSSTSTATRNAGEVDFVAANAYLDAYAKSRQGGQTRVVSVGWGVWSDIGMVARALDPSDPSQAPAVPVDAPLFGTIGFDRDGARLLRSRWEGARAWVLDQHRIGGTGPGTGTGLMPAAAMVELAAEGFLADGGTMPLEISDLRLGRPLLAGDGLTQTAARLRPDGATVRFELLSEVQIDGRPARLTHAEARLSALDAPPPPPVDLGAVALRCQTAAPRSAAEDDHLPVPQEARLAYGPAWHGLRETVLGAAEGLARLKLPDAALETRAPGMILHPGLFDLAMTWAVELAPNHVAGSLWLPDRCERIRVYRPLGAELACWVRRTEADGGPDLAGFEVTLCDLDGTVLAEIAGLRMRRVDTDALLAPAPADGIDVSYRDPAAPAHKRSAAGAQLAWNVSQGIRPGEGLAALERAVALGLPQVLVSSLDLAGLIAEADRTDPVARAPGQTFDRPDLATAYAAPETALEAALAEEWSKLLGIARVGIDDDFFDLGGHSLIAVRLCANVNKACGTEFGLAVLAEAPTIREWAARIERQTAAGDDADGAAGTGPAFTHVVPLNRARQTGATPLFLVAGMFGNVLNLRHIAQILGEDRPVYGLQAKGLLGDDAPCHSFAEAAASCLAEMRRIQPAGPYLVGGFSGGGITALEIARQLEAEGDQAALVVLLDTYKVQDPVLKRIDKALIKLAEFRRKGPRFLFEWARNRAAWEVEKRRGGGEEAQGTFHNYRIEMAFRDAIAAYEPPQYDMNVVLMRPAPDKHYKVSRGRFITSEKRYVSHDNDWGEHIPRLEVVEVPGDHGTMVLVPNVGVLATHLRRRIDAALETPGQTVRWDTPQAAE